MAGDKLGLLVEAEKRGFLPPHQQALLDEARRRGLVEPTISVGEDIAEQTPHTLGKIATAIPGTIGDLGGLYDMGLKFIADQALKFTGQTTISEAEAKHTEYLSMPTEAGELDRSPGQVDPDVYAAEAKLPPATNKIFGLNFPTTPGIRRGIGFNPRVAKTWEGKLVDKGLEFAGTSIIGPGGGIKNVVKEGIKKILVKNTLKSPERLARRTADVAKKLLGSEPAKRVLQGGVAGLTSETAVQLAPKEYEAQASMLGAILGAGGTGVIQSRASAYRHGLPGGARKVVRDTFSKLSNKVWKEAKKAKSDAKKAGVDLIVPEAFDAATAPNVGQLGSTVAQSTTGGPVINAALAKRNPALINLTEDAIESVAGAAIKDGQEVVSSVRIAAEKVIKDRIGSRTAATSPIYNIAKAYNVATASVKKLVGDVETALLNLPDGPLFNKSRKALEDVRDTLRKPNPKYTPGKKVLINDWDVLPSQRTARQRRRFNYETNTGKLDSARKELNRISKFDEFMADASAKEVSAFIGSTAGNINAILKGDNPIFRFAAERFKHMSIPVDKLIKGGRVKQLQELGPRDLASMYEIILDASKGNRPGTVKAILNQIASVDASAVIKLTRLHLENAFNLAQGFMQKSQQLNFGGNFYKNAFGNPQQMENVLAMVGESAKLLGGNPDRAVAGFRRFANALKRTSSVPGIGSPTATRAATSADMGRNITNVFNPLNFSEGVASFFTRRSYKAIAKVFTHENGIDILERIAKASLDDPKTRFLIIEAMNLGRSFEGEDRQ